MAVAVRGEGGIEPGSELERRVDDAMLRHPSGRRRGKIGFERVEILRRGWATLGVGLPSRPVYLLECQGCGALLRVGSPFLVAHHETHRRRPTVAGRARRFAFRLQRTARGRLARGEHYLRSLFGKD